MYDIIFVFCGANLSAYLLQSVRLWMERKTFLGENSKGAI